MSGLGLHPLGGEQAFGFEPVQDGIDGAFRQRQLRLALQKANDFKAIEAALPETGQSRHLHGALAQLRLPAVRLVAFSG